MKKIKNLIIALLLCTFGITGCSDTSFNNIVNTSMPYSAELLGYVSITNGTAIKNIDRIDNQLSVVYDNGDVLTYLSAIKSEVPSLSFDMNYTSSEKKSVDFVIEIIESILGDDFKDKITDDIKDELSSAIDNNSSAKLEFDAENCKVKIDFKQTDNVFSLCVECVG